MRHRGLAILVWACWLMAAPLGSRAETAKTEAVQFPNGKETANGFIAAPEKIGRYPAVIVIHEWWGLNDWAKQRTRELGEQGFVALAVDLYGGKVATTTAEAGELFDSVTPDQAIAELTAAYDYLNTRKDVSHDRIGVIGWGTGGSYALRLAMREPRMAAAVVNYGALPTDPNDILLVFCPVLGNFGADDHGVTAGDAQAFEKTFNAQNKRIDIKIYDGAGHGFANPANTESYNADAAADAWSRTVAFLNKMLK